MSNLELSESIHNKTLEEISYEIIQLLMSLVLGFFFKEVAHFIVCRIHALTLTGNFVRVFLCGHFIPLSQVFLNIRYLYIAMVSEDRSSIDRPTLYYCFWIPGFPGAKIPNPKYPLPLNFEKLFASPTWRLHSVLKWGRQLFRCYTDINSLTAWYFSDQFQCLTILTKMSCIKWQVSFEAEDKSFFPLCQIIETSIAAWSVYVSQNLGLNQQPKLDIKMESIPNAFPYFL